MAPDDASDNGDSASCSGSVSKIGWFIFLFRSEACMAISFLLSRKHLMQGQSGVKCLGMVRGTHLGVYQIT